MSVVTDTPTIAPAREFDEAIAELRHDDLGQYGAGWYCVRTGPWSCPAPGCGFVASFMTAAHLIVVWPQNDDPSLLAQARNARDAGRSPRIVEYRGDFGPCIAFDEWRRLGCIVHGYAPKPAGWSDSDRRRL